MSLLKCESGNYTYEDYLNWDENQRCEIIDGIPYMQAAPGLNHQAAAVELCTQFRTYLRGKTCKVFIAPFTVLLGDEKKHTDIKDVFEPDIAIICDHKKISDKKICGGAPDLIIEILSPSTAKIDRFQKFIKYEEAGVREYWIAEPDSKIISVFTLQENKKYGRPEIYTDENKIKVSIFEDLYIDLKLVFEEE